MVAQQRNSPPHSLFLYIRGGASLTTFEVMPAFSRSSSVSEASSDPSMLERTSSATSLSPLIGRLEVHLFTSVLLHSIMALLGVEADAWEVVKGTSLIGELQGLFPHACILLVMMIKMRMTLQ
jgi:hypothetical protein